MATKAPKQTQAKTETKRRVHVKDGALNVDATKGGNVAVFVKPGGKAPSKDLPKGEKRVEVGVRIKFGGGKKK
jgi:hypothetical protein